MRKTVSVIIPTYNRSESLRRTIKSLLSQSFNKKDYEILIVDNDSSDNTPEIVQELIKNNFDGPEIRYIFEDRPGVHFARNRGAKEAKNEILYFTDDDIEADKNVLEELVKVFDIDERVGVATGLVLPKFENNPPDWVKDNCQNLILSVNPHMKGKQMMVAKESFGVFNCHEAVSKNVFFQTSGIHPENTKGVWFGDGDTGFNRDIKKLGFKFGFNPDALTYHCIPADRTTQKYVNKRLFNQGFCDSFSEYRKSRSLIIACLQSIEQFFRMPYFLIKAGILAILKNSKWHLAFSQIFYSYARIKYNFLLLTNSEIRKNNLQKSWL